MQISYLLAPQSGAHIINPHRDPNPIQPIPLIALTMSLRNYDTRSTSGYQEYQEDQDQISDATYISDVVFPTVNPLCSIYEWTHALHYLFRSTDLKTDLLQCPLILGPTNKERIRASDIPKSDGPLFV